MGLRGIMYEIEFTIEAIKDTAQFLYNKKKINRIPVFRYDKSFVVEAKALQKSK